MFRKETSKQQNSKSTLSSTRLMAAFAMFALAFTSPVFAQIAPFAADTSKPVFYAAPPADFDPLLASDADLAKYGIPPRPDQSQPELVADWQKLVTAPQTRLTNLKLQTTNIVNGVVKNRANKGSLNNTSFLSSSNWSAYAITSPNGTFAANNSHVRAEWVMPAAGADNCQYGTYYSSQWVGLDGVTSNDVLQAGTQISACGTSYTAWYEWFTAGCTVNSTAYPCYEVAVSLPINPGDLIYTYVWYTTSAPNGHALIYNFTTQQGVSLGFYQPPGPASSAYQGNGAEWVVERPEVGGSLANLENYIALPMNVAYAGNGTSVFYPSSVPSGSTIYGIFMTCPPWNPSSACSSTTDISIPNLYGTYTLWFYDSGPAYVAP